MASIETSYFNFFMEDLISFKEELFSDSDDCLHKSVSQQLHSHCVTNDTSLRNLSVQSTPQRRSAPSHHLTWDCRSQGRGIGCVCFGKMKTVFAVDCSDDLDLVKRRESLRSQLAVTFSDQSIPRPAVSSAASKAPDLGSHALLVRPLCPENRSGICASGDR